MKDQIFSILSHDLRKPILAFQNISKKINYLLEKQSYQSLQRLGNELEKDTRTLSQIIENLLSWALQQKGIMRNNPKWIELKSAVTEISQQFERRATKKNIRIISEIPEQLKLLVDEQNLNAILRNLIDNALKFSEQDGQIEIVANNVANDVEIQIKRYWSRYLSRKNGKHFHFTKR